MSVSACHNATIVPDAEGVRRCLACGAATDKPSSTFTAPKFPCPCCRTELAIDRLGGEWPNFDRIVVVETGIYRPEADPTHKGEVDSTIEALLDLRRRTEPKE